MKVAHLTATFPPYRGGMGNAAAQFAVMYARHHEVTVFTPRYRDVIPSADASSFRVEWLGTPITYGNAAGLPQLLWRLRSFDLIHLHYPFYGAHLAVLFASLLWRRPLILHYHMDSLADGFKGSIFEFNRRYVFPLLVNRADVIVGSSLDYLAHSHIAPYLKVHPEKFHEIPFWVDSKKFHPVAEEPGPEIVLLFVATLDQAHYFKGLEVLLRAMQVIIKKCSRPVILRVVGSGALHVYYQQLASELEISDRVQFSGKMDDAGLVRAYQKASFLILPSINQGEAFGLVLLEAMSSGKPVIASNLPGVRSVFKDGREGLIVRVGDVQDLAEKVIMLAEDETLRAQMGQRARELVEKKYCAPMAEQEIESICSKLAPGK